jgi:nucleoid-associated protein Lsr2
LDGVSYRGGLSNENAGELRDALAQFVEHARRSDREKNQDVRWWARRSGYELSDRGRSPNDVVEAYRESLVRIVSASGTPRSV